MEYESVPTDDRIKLKDCEKKDKYLDIVRKLKKIMEHKSDGYTNCNWCSWYSHQRISTWTGGLGKKTGRVKTVQTTALLRSARILKRLETWNLLSFKVKDRQLTLM